MYFQLLLLHLQKLQQQTFSKALQDFKYYLYSETSQVYVSCQTWFLNATLRHFAVTVRISHRNFKRKVSKIKIFDPCPAALPLIDLTSLSPILVNGTAVYLFEKSKPEHSCMLVLILPLVSSPSANSVGSTSKIYRISFAFLLESTSHIHFK